MESRLRMNKGKRCNITPLNGKTFQSIIVEVDQGHLIYLMGGKNFKLISLDSIEGLEIYGEQKE